MSTRENSMDYMPGEMPERAARRLAAMMLLHAYEDCALALSDTLTPRRNRQSLKGRAAATEWAVAVKWFNGAESPFPLDLVAALRNQTPAQLRQQWAARIGLETKAPEHLIEGPFTVEHGERANDVRNAAREMLKLEGLAYRNSNGGNDD